MPALGNHKPPINIEPPMLAWHVQHACSWRHWDHGNVSVPTYWTYGIEMLLHELFLQRLTPLPHCKASVLDA